MSVIAALTVSHPRMEMTVDVIAEALIHNHVRMPVRMVMFPTMNASQADGIRNNPYIAPTQIIACPSHVSHVFVTVPVIVIRYGRLFFHHRRARRRRWRRWLSVNTPGQQQPCDRRRQGINNIFYFHASEVSQEMCRARFQPKNVRMIEYPLVFDRF